MNSDQNNVFLYFLVIDSDSDEQTFIRKAINRLVPRVMVESLYDSTETLSYFNSCKQVPNLIFLDAKMAFMGGRCTISMIRSTKYMDQVPIVIFTNYEGELNFGQPLLNGAGEMYLRPDHLSEFTGVMKKVFRKWLKVS